MKWWYYYEQEEPDHFRLPVRPTVTVFCVIILISVAIRAVTWPENKHINADFLMQAVMFPAFALITLGLFILFVASSVRHYLATRLAIKNQQDEEIKRYARDHLIIAGRTVLTPLAEPALNMLKLEGDFPLAPKTPLMIPSEEAFEVTRNEMLLERLVVPLADKLKNHYSRFFEAAIWVRGGDESYSEILQRILERQGVKVNKIEYLPDCPDYSLLDKWIDCARDCIFNRLLVTIDLHDDEVESKSMENACAFLLTNQYSEIEGEFPVYLYRPLTEIVDVEEMLPIYLYAESVSAPKTLWYTGLSRTQKYPLLQVLDEKKIVANRLDIEASFGEKTAGYQWLALALAADATMYAQGNQLVAAGEITRMAITALSSHLTPEPISYQPVIYMYPWLYGLLAGFMFGTTSVSGFCLYDKKDAFSDGWFLIVIGFFSIFCMAYGALITFFMEKRAMKHMRGY
ncbi:hypothetical protein [Pseudescherichia sp.]|uniref:hypothetical protein n=1 Tax=Pseudescherichia sp. TaxID=2055881 RepID=UPI0028A1AB29|nr:hypothetical protein [Pseudescherichia sp.]